MRDYWLTQYLLAAVGWGYVAVTAFALGLALWLPNGKIAKAIAALFIVGLASIIPIRGYQGYLKEKQAAEEFKLRYAKAKALFDERCKTTGEKIYRTVENVEGVLMMKRRPTEINLSDQYRLDDPFGSDCHGDECISELLRITNGGERNPELSAKLQSGFSFVDMVDAADGRRYRYQGVIESGNGHRLSLQRAVTELPLPRFGITWDDVSTKVDRDYWIAGGVLKVVDIKSSEVIGERRGYMMDRGQGNQVGGRSPWAFA